MGKSCKKKIKPMSSRKKCKIMKNVAELKRKFRRKRKKYSKFRKLFDLEAPNHLLFEDNIPLLAERWKRREDLRDIQEDWRLKLETVNSNIEDLIDETTQKVRDCKMCHDHETENSSLKHISDYMQYKEVVDAADIIVQVLDARDPLGSRCSQVEELVLNTGKKLILVLNKIDLIPKNNLIEWLKYLRQELPTVAFKASIETQNDYLLQSESVVVHMTESLLSSCYCVGASFLINLLKNYCRNQNIHTLVKVGVVGFPNVGKHSVIRSLKQSCSTPEATDITNAIKNLSLDKHLEILDNSGNVFAKDDSLVTLALHNAVKVEDLKDVISVAEAIVQKVNHMQLCLHYCIPHFSSCHELFCSLAAKMDKFKKTGSPDFEVGAKRLINDWNCGKIKYYTYPPEMFIRSKHITAEYTAQVSKVFDISLEKEQTELDKAPLLFPVVSIAAKSSETTGLLEKGLKTNGYAIGKVTTEFVTNKENVTEEEDESNELLTEHHLQKLFKKYKKLKYKRKKHKKKKFYKLALALSESVN